MEEPEIIEADDGALAADGRSRRLVVDPAALARAVVASAGDATVATLAASTGLTPRTVRAVLAGDGSRQFTRPTLAKLDGPLGWEPGTAWQHYRGATRPAADLAAAHLQLVDERLDDVSWMVELILLVGRLSEDDRQTVLALARRLDQS